VITCGPGSPVGTTADQRRDARAGGLQEPQAGRKVRGWGFVMATSAIFIPQKGALCLSVKKTLVGLLSSLVFDHE